MFNESFKLADGDPVTATHPFHRRRGRGSRGLSNLLYLVYLLPGISLRSLYTSSMTPTVVLLYDAVTLG